MFVNTAIAFAVVPDLMSNHVCLYMLGQPALHVPDQTCGATARDVLNTVSESLLRVP